MHADDKLINASKVFFLFSQYTCIAIGDKNGLVKKKRYLKYGCAVRSSRALL